MTRKLVMTPQAIASRKWKQRNADMVNEYNINYYKTHSSAEIQRRHYYKKVSAYNKQITILFKILNAHFP